MRKLIISALAVFLIPALFAQTSTITATSTRTNTPVVSDTRTLSPTRTFTYTATPTPTVTLRTVKKSGGDYATLAAAVADCWVGDIIEIRDSGVYNETFRPTSSITLRVQAGQSFLPTIGSSATGGIGIDLNSLPVASQVTVQGDGGLTVVGSKHAIRASASCGSIDISRAYLKNTENFSPVCRFVRTGNSSISDVISQCTINGQSKPYNAGIYYLAQTTPQPNFKSYNNLIINAGDAAHTANGIHVAYSGTPTTRSGDVVCNTIYNCTGYGVYAVAPVSVVNSIFSTNAAGNISVPTPAAISYCAFTTATPVGGSSSIGVTAATEFVNPGVDWTLNSYAACVDSATGVATPYAITVDHDNDARPSFSGNRVDRGAYEFQMTRTPTVSATWTPTATETSTATWTSTMTLTDTETSTPTWTPTHTTTATETWTPTWSSTSTETSTPTWTATVTPTMTCWCAVDLMTPPSEGKDGWNPTLAEATRYLIERAKAYIKES